MKKSRTQEPQYDELLQLRDEKGLTRLGLHANQIWHDDPRRFLIMLSRYKFIGKMLSGSENVLEVGCGDAFGSRLVLQECKKLTAVDFDPEFVKDVNERMESRWEFDCRVHDIRKGPVKPGGFDAAYSLDVLEHIPKKDEDRFMRHVLASVRKGAPVVIGMPSLESQAYASPRSRRGHVNCKKAPELKALMKKYFRDVFVFSMNDEVVHTGFSPLAHYLFAIGSGRRK